MCRGDLANTVYCYMGCIYSPALAIDLNTTIKRGGVIFYVQGVICGDYNCILGLAC